MASTEIEHRAATPGNDCPHCVAQMAIGRDVAQRAMGQRGTQHMDSLELDWLTSAACDEGM